MNYKTFTFTNNRYIITHVRETYSRTASGKSWKKAPDETKTETITAQQYENWVTSVPFFNGFCGGTCRAACSYTMAGYLPTHITTTAPGKEKQYKDFFSFDRGE